jgi:hypothetical protein
MLSNSASKVNGKGRVVTPVGLGMFLKTQSFNPN